ncbi:Hypothetical predicted protein [Lecanosticta acicola]|uniref:Uncharacterized protein n=1 Tax=Lecanosticta acicola TaxID=111012 RepID=A0AAI8Z5K1_9PEZI|nr:Hypothetical predicted protein [Lecanosticta acicola]
MASASATAPTDKAPAEMASPDLSASGDASSGVDGSNASDSSPTADASNTAVASDKVTAIDTARKDSVVSSPATTSKKRPASPADKPKAKKQKQAGPSTTPASTTTLPPTTTSATADDQWDAFGVLAQQRNNFRMAWTPDRHTGERYEPSWTCGRRNVGHALLAEWDSWKARNPGRKSRTFDEIDLALLVEEPAS